MVALTMSSGSSHLKKAAFDLSNVETIAKIKRRYPVWLDSSILGSSATWIPEPIAGTGSAVLINRHNKKSEHKNEVATENLANLVAKIQSVFSLNISEIATILAVQRPTIYAWVNGDSIPHRSNYKRLQDLYTLAETVQTTFGATLSKLQKGRAIEGLTLIDLLSHETISQQEVTKHLNNLMTMQGPQESRVRSFREMAKAANKPFTVNQDGQMAIDHLTGKRFTED